MNHEVTHLPIHQNAKVLSFLFFLFSALFFVPLSLMNFFVTGDPMQLALLAVPFVIWLLAYIKFVILTWLYNFAAECVGGFSYREESRGES